MTILHVIKYSEYLREGAEPPRHIHEFFLDVLELHFGFDWGGGDHLITELREALLAYGEPL